MLDELTIEQIDEAFKEYEEGKIKYPPVNLKPKDAIPQVFGFNFPGTDQFVLFLGNYSGKYDEASKLKQGATMAQVLPMSLSPKGAPTQLKGGLGSDPIGAISSIFDTAYSVAKEYNIGALMFRFPIKKMKGQGAVLTRVMSRLVQTKTAGKFVVLDTPARFEQSTTAGKKYAFLIIAQKSKMKAVVSKLEVDLSKFEKYSVGGVPKYKSKSTGVVVDEQDARIISVIDKEQKKPEKTPKIRLSRGELAKMYSMGDVSPALQKEIGDAAATHKPSAPVVDVIGRINAKDTVVTLKTYEEKFNYDLLNLTNGVSKTPLFGSGTKDDKYFAEKYLKQVDVGSKFYDGVKLLDAVQELATYRKPTKKKYEERIASVLRRINYEIGQKAWLNYRVERADLADHKESALYKAVSKIADVERYRAINGALLGTAETVSKQTINDIKEIDELFKTNSIKLPKGLSVYRCQTMPRTVAVSAMQNKMFYFANYVSTSLKPIMFSSDRRYSMPGLQLGGKEIDMTVAQDQLSAEETLQLGFVIDDVDKTNVINAMEANVETSTEDAEIILPRGTVLKFNKVSEAGGKNYFIQASVATALYENTPVYDGDLFMETGELVEKQGLRGFKSFLTEETQSESKDDFYKTLAGMMNFDDVPERFKS